jgi:predicted aspartyl protease
MEFMDGLYNRTTMPLTYVTVSMSRVGSSENRFDAQFAVNAGTTETMASRSALIGAGIEPAGMTTYELADGSLHEYSFGLAQIEFMGEITAGRVIFGPDGVEPILGVTALESVGITVDPATHSLKRLPAIPLK